jgi:hypothetical protein
MRYAMSGGLNLLLCKTPLISERGAPFSAAGFAKMVERAGEAAGFKFKAHSHMLRHVAGTTGVTGTHRIVGSERHVRADYISTPLDFSISSTNGYAVPHCQTRAAMAAFDSAWTPMAP